MGDKGNPVELQGAANRYNVGPWQKIECGLANEESALTYCRVHFDEVMAFSLLRIIDSKGKTVMEDTDIRSRVNKLGQ